MQNHGQFSLTIPLLKTWQDGEGALRFEGVAASTSLDRQAERLTSTAIEKMQQYTGIDLLPSHSAGVLQELGIVEKCWVDNDQFRVAGYLEPGNPEAARLYERLKLGKQYGLSVGGRVLKAHWDFDTEAGRQVKYIDDVVLDHIAVCRPTQAANPDTYLTAMAKAAEAVLEEMPVAESTGDSSALPEAVTGEAVPDEAIFTRLGKTIVEACQKIWPFGGTQQQGRTEATDSISSHPFDSPLPQGEGSGVRDQARADTQSLGVNEAKGLEEHVPGPQSSDHDPAALLDRLQKQVDSLSAAVDQLSQDLEVSPPEAPQDVTPGRPQAIPGQTKSTNDQHVTWKGVL